VYAKAGPGVKEDKNLSLPKRIVGAALPKRILQFDHLFRMF